MLAHASLANEYACDILFPSYLSLKPFPAGGAQSADAHHVRHVWCAVLRAWRAAAQEAADCKAQHAAQHARTARSSTLAGRAAAGTAASGAQARPEQRQPPAMPFSEQRATGADRRPVCRSRAGWGVTAVAATCSAAPAAPLHAFDRNERGLVPGRIPADGSAVGFALRPQDQGEGAEFAAAEVVLAAATAALGRTVAQDTLRAPRPDRLAWKSPALATSRPLPV